MQSLGSLGSLPSLRSQPGHATGQSQHALPPRLPTPVVKPGTPHAHAHVQAHAQALAQAQAQAHIQIQTQQRAASVSPASVARRGVAIAKAPTRAKKRAVFVQRTVGT